MRGVAAELIRLRLADRHDPVCSQVVGRHELEGHLTVSAGFQISLPKRERAKFLAHILGVLGRFLFPTPADGESFLGQTEFGEIVDVTVERLVSAYGKRISRIKSFADLRQLPIAQLQNGVVHCEHEQIGIGNRFVLRSHEDFTAYHLTRFRGRAGETRLDF